MKKILFYFLLIVSTFASAQDGFIEISGKVTDEFGASLIGVNISSGNSGTYSNFDGTYKLKVVNDPKTKITFTSIGFASQTIEIGTQKNIEVILQENTLKIDEVVVIGYGTQKRSNVTGSVAKVKSEKIENAPVVRLDQALQGKIAGVSIQNTSSAAGADTEIRIRGISSINAGASPLVVVDGQPVPDGLASVNNADVESVEVLKDAASAAIYGSRGASGVILITTKSGKADKPRFTFRSSLGFKEAYKTHNMLSITEYVELLYRERDLRVQDPNATTINFNQPILAQYAIEQNLFGGQGVDYQAEILRRGIYRDNQLNVSGGTKDLKYFISTGYQEDEAMFVKSNLQRLNFRAKLDVKLSEKIKLNINLNPSHSKTEFPEPDYTDFYRFPSYLPIFHTEASAAYINNNNPNANIRPGDFAENQDFFNNVYSGIGPDGVPFTSTTQFPFNSRNVNPYRRLTQNDENQNQFRFQGSSGLTFELSKDLKFTTTANIYHRSDDRLNWSSTGSRNIGEPNRGTFIRRTYFDFLTENTLNYKKEINDHSFDAIAGFTYQSTESKSEQISGTNFPTDDIRTLSNAGVLDLAQTFGFKEKIGLQSILGRLNYSYRDRYLLSLSYRTDGSSLFAEGEKWGGFPAASVGWVVSKENFMANITAINRLNLRASYGVTGNNRIGTFSYQNLLNSTGYVFGAGNGGVVLGQGSLTDVTGNRDITWERTFQNNYGVDISAFRNRLDLSIDFFTSKTDRLLLQQPTQSFTGAQRFFNNVGSLYNEGLEIELETKNIVTNNFKWSSSINFSTVRNKIDNLGNVDLIRNIGQRGEIYQNQVGNPLVEYYGYKTDGVWLSDAEIATAQTNGLTSNLQNYFQSGGLKIVDINGDNRIDEQDRTVLGNPYADFNWGFTNNFTFKNLQLSFTMQGVQGGELINGDLFYNEMRQRNATVIENRWISPANPGDGRTPYETRGVQWMVTDYVVEDASYASLREVNLSYNFNEVVAKKLKLSGMRLFLAAQNLYYWTAEGYRGINPEARRRVENYDTPLIDGHQRGGFPIPRTLIFGVEVNF